MTFREQQQVGRVGLWDRVRNVFTNEFGNEADIRKDERDRLTTELNQQLLESVAEIKNEWHDDLVHGMPDQGLTAAGYRSYIEGLSAAQQSLQEVNPRIEADIDPARIRAEAQRGVAVERAAEEQAFWDDLDPAESAQEEQHREDFPVRQVLPSNPIVEALIAQEKNIRDEWCSDLQTGRLHRHSLDSYFAGRVDQHNALIEMTVAAHPELRETLPPLIEYGAVREELQQQANKQVFAGPQEDLASLYHQRELVIAGLQQQQVDTMQAIIRQSREQQLSLERQQHSLGIAV